ncbi:MAG: ABC transporter ATP-binding protein [Gammaproteobacteria bacterium]
MNLPKTPYAFIYHFIKRQPWGFGIIFFAAISWSANDIFFPYFIKLIVNILHEYHGLTAGVYAALAQPIIYLILFWINTEFWLRMQGIAMIYTIPKFRANIRAQVYDYVKQHSHEYFANNFAGNIAKKIADLPNSAQAVIEVIAFSFIPTIIGILIALILMWFTQPIFAAILLLWFVIHIGITILFMRAGNSKWDVHSESAAVLTGKIVDSFTNILNVRLFARSDYESKYLQHFQRDEIEKAKSAMWFIEIMRFCQGIAGFLMIVAMIFALVHGWTKGYVTLGDFAQIGMQAFWLLGMVWYMSYQMTVYVREMGVVNNALSLINIGHDIVDAKDAKRLCVSKGEICFDNVSFAYHKKHSIFKNLSVTIKAGQKVGLVGFSGSGKTTFVNLILRFHDLDAGQILIDGQNIANVTQDSLRAQIAMIPQDPTLFHRTLMENIRYGRLTASDEEVISAAKLANCEDFIEKMPEKYNSMVGERGLKLSGGQRQRVAIARAILKNAPFLILDEATSALDSVTENLIQEGLQRVMQGRTALVVAHRLSTLADMDRIIVFHKGEIIEDGTQEELLNLGGHFATLWNMQTDGFLPEETDLEGEGEGEEGVIS